MFVLIHSSSRRQFHKRHLSPSKLDYFPNIKYHPPYSSPFLHPRINSEFIATWQSASRRLDRAEAPFLRIRKILRCWPRAGRNCFRSHSCKDTRGAIPSHGSAFPRIHGRDRERNCVQAPHPDPGAVTGRRQQQHAEHLKHDLVFQAWQRLRARE